MPRIMEAYLHWKYGATPLDAPSSPGYDFDLDRIDYFSDETSLHVPRTSEQGPAEALVRYGYLSPTPDQPTIAVSLETLELFHNIRRFKPSFSVEAFTKMVCYKNYVTKALLELRSYSLLISDLVCRSPTAGDIGKRSPTPSICT